MARVTNALLVRWHGGFVVVSDAASIAANGRHEDFLSAGDVQSVAEAQRVGNALLTKLAKPTEQTTVRLEPTGTGDVPYVNVVVGDTVTALDSTGTSRTWRVTGFNVTEDNEGNPIYGPELQLKP